MKASKLVETRLPPSPKARPMWCRLAMTWNRKFLRSKSNDLSWQVMNLTFCQLQRMDLVTWSASQEGGADQGGYNDVIDTLINAAFEWEAWKGFPHLIPK